MKCLGGFDLFTVMIIIGVFNIVGSVIYLELRFHITRRIWRWIRELLNSFNAQQNAPQNAQNDNERQRLATLLVNT